MENIKPEQPSFSTPMASKQKFGWQWLIIPVLLLLGVFLLRSLGSSFVREVIQEVPQKEAEVLSVDIGKDAPYFESINPAGNVVKLSDFLGKPVVIVFWTTWNLQSVDQIKILSDYLAGAGNLPFSVVAINNQEEKSVVSNFIARSGYAIDVLFDEQGLVGEVYKARSLPAIYFVDETGVLQDIHVGVLTGQVIVDKVGEILKN